MKDDPGLLELVREGFRLMYETRNEIPRGLLEILKFVFKPALLELRNLTQNENFINDAKWRRQAAYVFLGSTQAAQILNYYLISDIVTSYLM